MKTLQQCVDSFFEEHAKWKAKNDSGDTMADTSKLHRAAQEIGILYGIEPTFDAISKCRDSLITSPLPTQA